MQSRNEPVGGADDQGMNRRTAARLSSRGLRTVFWAIVGLAVLAAFPWVLAVGAMLAATALLWWYLDRAARGRRPRAAGAVDAALTV